MRELAVSRRPVLGMVTLGQTPRLDFEQEFGRHCPDAELQMLGALDGLSKIAIAALDNPAGAYPLHTRLADGSVVNIPIADLQPLVQLKASQLAAAGVDLVVILCAGAIDVSCDVPVLLPARIMPAIVSGLTVSRTIDVLVPHRGQEAVAAEHWRRHGYEPTVAAASPFRDDEMASAANLLKASPAMLVVVDCMGHDVRYGAAFGALVGKPTLLTQSVVARLTGELMDAFGRRRKSISAKSLEKELTKL